MRNNYQNPITEDMDEFGEVIPTMIQRKALQTQILKMENYEKMLASPLYMQSGGNRKSQRIPTASVKPAALIQEREASAKRSS